MQVNLTSDAERKGWRAKPLDSRFYPPLAPLAEEPLPKRLDGRPPKAVISCKIQGLARLDWE